MHQNSASTHTHLFDTQGLSALGLTPEDLVGSVIDEGLVIEGPIQSTNGRGLIIAGTTKSMVECDGVVLIAPTGKALGGIRAHLVIVAGEVVGSQVCASACLVVRSQAVIKVEKIEYGALEFEKGGRIEGCLVPVPLSEAVQAWDQGRQTRKSQKSSPLAAVSPFPGASSAPLTQSPQKAQMPAQGVPAPSFPSTVPGLERLSRTEIAAASMRQVTES